MSARDAVDAMNRLMEVDASMPVAEVEVDRHTVEAAILRAIDAEEAVEHLSGLLRLSVLAERRLEMAQAARGSLRDVAAHPQRLAGVRSEQAAFAVAIGLLTDRPFPDVLRDAQSAARARGDAADEG